MYTVRTSTKQTTNRPIFYKVVTSKCLWQTWYIIRCWKLTIQLLECNRRYACLTGLAQSGIVYNCILSLEFSQNTCMYCGCHVCAYFTFVTSISMQYVSVLHDVFYIYAGVSVQSATVCRDKHVWIADGSAECSALVTETIYGLHTNPDYWCNRYSLTDCCETCSRLQQVSIGRDTI